MTDIALPSLAGLARMVPVYATAAPANVGAGWTVVAYTAPLGRAVAVDWIEVVAAGGTLPTSTLIRVRDAAGNEVARLRREAQAAVLQPIVVDNTVWLQPGYEVNLINFGGDATTDMEWAVAGRAFDWADDT